MDKLLLINRVEAKLTSITEPTTGRSRWTGLIKKAFIELADEYGYKVATAGAAAQAEGGRKPDWVEWLYDLVWYTSVIEKDSGVERTTSVPLVMECEWDASLDAIALDLDKLLVSNADLRVLVCGEYRDFKRDEVFAYCARALAGYEQGKPGDAVLVCVVPEDGPVAFELFQREKGHDEVSRDDPAQLQS